MPFCGGQPPFAHRQTPVSPGDVEGDAPPAQRLVLVVAIIPATRFLLCTLASPGA